MYSRPMLDVEMYPENDNQKPPECFGCSTKRKVKLATQKFFEPMRPEWFLCGKCADPVKTPNTPRDPGLCTNLGLR